MTEAYSGWAVVELMGHRRRAGVVREVEQFGAKLLRIDIPAGEGSVTEYYGGGAIYALRPCEEDVARQAAASIGDPRPVHPNSFRPALRGPVGHDPSLDEDEIADPFDVGQGE